MHDPMTVAFEFRYPWRAHRHPRNEFERGYREAWCTIWHVDPCRDGTDDSCGLFMRARHGDKATLEKIVKEFDFNWDRVFQSDSGRCYPSGLFHVDGEPYLSTHGITLNLFFSAAHIAFGHDRDRAMLYLNRHLAEILIFAENPVDSLHDGIVRKFQAGCGEAYDSKARAERIRDMAVCIYGYILRDTRPWWRHPRFHFWHWKVNIHCLQNFKRWAFSRCSRCGRGFRWGYAPCSGWTGGGPSWFKGEKGVWHSDCSDPGSYGAVANPVDKGA